MVEIKFGNNIRYIYIEPDRKMVKMDTTAAIIHENVTNKESLFDNDCLYRVKYHIGRPRNDVK